MQRMPARSRQLLAVLWRLALVSAYVIAMLPLTAHANGRVVRFMRQIAGPYEIALGTIPGDPVVGPLHLTITVSDTSSSAFILDAVVTVTGKGPDRDAREIGPLRAQNNPGTPLFYDINTSVDRVGTWTLTILVSGELGDASADFLIEVGQPNPVSVVLSWIFGAVLLGVLVWSALHYLRGRGRNRKRKSRGNS